MNHQWVGNSEKLETSKISPPAGIGYQRDNFVFTKKMGYNVQAAIKFWHVYYKCVRELSVTLIVLVSLFIFVILPAIPLVLLHFIKWYLKHIGTQRLMIHQIFLLAHNWPKCMWQKLSFLPASLSENCLCFGTDNVHGKISVHIFAPNRGYCLHIPAKRYPNVIATPTLTNTPSFL